MSIFSLKKNKAPVVSDLPTECHHWELAPRWDSAADIGKADRATSYKCTACGKELTLDEARDRVGKP